MPVAVSASEPGSGTVLEFSNIGPGASSCGNGASVTNGVSVVSLAGAVSSLGPDGLSKAGADGLSCAGGGVTVGLVADVVSVGATVESAGGAGGLVGGGGAASGGTVDGGGVVPPAGGCDIEGGVAGGGAGVSLPGAVSCVGGTKLLWSAPFAD